MDKKFPQVVSLCFAIASQLSGFVNSSRIRPTEIRFVGLKLIERGNKSFIRFKMEHKGKSIGPAQIGQVAI